MPVYTVILKYLSVIVVGYLLGSVPMAIPVSRLLFNKDVREEGSNNAGTTNMARVYGMGAGAFTLVGDILKTVLAIWFGRILLGEPGHFCAGVAALFGHCWPVFYEFRGGKGISAGAVIALFISWKLLAILAVVFLLGAFISKKVSLGSVLAAAAMIIAVFFVTDLMSLRILAVFTAVVVLYRHIPNIRRLIRHEEPDFKLPSHKNRKK